MTPGTGQRQYRACVRCRSRKTRCDLESFGEPGKPPCAKCVREGAECELAGSRRGGDYSQYRRHHGLRQRQGPPSQSSQSIPSAASPLSVTTGPSPGRTASHDEIASHSLQNPSDALLILAHAAGSNEEFDSENEGSQGLAVDDDSITVGGYVISPKRLPVKTSRTQKAASKPPPPYALIADGTLDQNQAKHLLRHFAERYHPFFPIVPLSVLQTSRLSDTMENEPFLLTAILMIASKDHPDMADVNTPIWAHMKLLLLDVVLGMTSVRHVGCVEGLLLLGEWTPLPVQGLGDEGSEGAAWSILGLAVRLAYHLRLEDSSFKGENENDPNLQRRRLAWTFTYLLDRQISIRMGQAFWCRGPALSTRFRAEDFPSLQPRRHGNEDYASLLQAQVELTTLFGNAHDILFASKARTAELMTRGDYTKYIDDAMRALAAWHGGWQHIAVSGFLRRCLMLMQHFLRFYINAFAFQAVLYRTTKDKGLTGLDSIKAVSFPDSTMATPDARPVYEAIDAAETLLKIVVEEINPEEQLRYMPARFYLYEIHSAVFLYKAHALGAMSSGKHSETSQLIGRFVGILLKAATNESHVAYRYAKLIERLWFRRPAQGNVSTAEVNESGNEMGELSMGDPLLMLPGGLGDMHTPSLEEFGFCNFESIDTVEGLFSMPGVFSWDQTAF